MPASAAPGGDRNRVLVDDSGQWKLYDSNADQVGAVAITDRPPTVVDNLIVTVQGHQVTATGLNGQPGWHTDIPFESPGIESLPGAGLLFVEWDDSTDSFSSTALDLQGKLLDDDTTLLAQADLVEVEKVELPTAAFDLETPPTVLSSDSGLVVVTGGIVSGERTMHVYR